MITECGYSVKEGTECYGSCNVPKFLCERCKVFIANTPIQTIKKSHIVKQHAFGVTIECLGIERKVKSFNR